MAATCVPHKLNPGIIQKCYRANFQRTVKEGLDPLVITRKQIVLSKHESYRRILIVRIRMSQEYIEVIPFQMFYILIEVQYVNKIRGGNATELKYLSSKRVCPTFTNSWCKKQVETLRYVSTIYYIMRYKKCAIVQISSIK